MNSKTIFTAILLLISVAIVAQVSGNQVYQANYKHTDRGLEEVPMTWIVNENVQTYKISILNNVQADSYLVTFGVNQEGKTIESCHQKMNVRIDAFLKELTKLKIEKSNVYVDFISQTKIFDYQNETQSNEVKSTQVDKGFETKRNIIIKISDILLLDEISTLASKFDIYNLIKVDYINQDFQSIYQKMLLEAEKIFKNKQNSMEAFGLKSIHQSPAIQVKTYSIQPKNQYKNYTAFESSDVSYTDYYQKNTYYLKKELRKDKTFYFDSQDVTQFDLVMNPDSPIVGIQYVLEMTITTAKKEDKKEDIPAKKYHIITQSGQIVEIPQL